MRVAAILCALLASCAPSVQLPPDLARVPPDASYARPDVQWIGTPRRCCECDVRDEVGDLPAVCVTPCAQCLAETGRDGGDVNGWLGEFDFTVAADFAACECTGARL